VKGLDWNATTKKGRVVTEDGEELEADGVILAIPAYAAAVLAGSLTPELAQELRAIPYVSTATVSLAFRQADVPKPLNGFGFVVPAIEARGIIACTFSSVKYSSRAPEGYVLLRAFVGGALQPGLFDQDDPRMEKSVREEFASLLGITAAPLFCRIYRHSYSMPQYHVGHLEWLERVEDHLKRLPGLALAGSAYQGVGIADCVHSGEEAAGRLLDQLH
jgi:oxygen-dependent protoporphyrinogen oxidase